MAAGKCVCVGGGGAGNGPSRRGAAATSHGGAAQSGAAPPPPPPAGLPRSNFGAGSTSVRPGPRGGGTGHPLPVKGSRSPAGAPCPRRCRSGQERVRARSWAAGTGGGAGPGRWLPCGVGGQFSVWVFFSLFLLCSWRCPQGRVPPDGAASLGIWLRPVVLLCGARTVGCGLLSSPALGAWWDG